MTNHTSMSSGEHPDQCITAQLIEGHYNSATEAVYSGLELLENEEQKLETLRTLIAEGKASGEAEYSYEKFMAELDKEFD